MANQPRIVTRREWGGRGSRSGTIAPSRRSYYVVHWPVMGMRDPRQWMREMETMHINQGWGMIGYSFAVAQDGTILEGCGLTTRPIHSPSRNSDGWGICHLQPSTAAGAPTAAITPAMRNASRALYEWLSAQAGRRLHMWWHGRDWATACPGPELRAWVQQGMPAGTAPPPAPAPPPQPQRRNELLASGRSMNRDGSPGNLHVFTGRGNTIFYRFRNRQGKWNPADRWATFAQGRSGQEAISLACGLDNENTFHVWVEWADRSSSVSWQRAGDSNWSGLRAFAKL